MTSNYKGRKGLMLNLPHLLVDKIGNLREAVFGRRLDSIHRTGVDYADRRVTMSMDFKCERCGHRGGFRRRGIAGGEIPLVVLTFIIPGIYLISYLLSRPGLVCPDCKHAWK